MSEPVPAADTRTERTEPDPGRWWALVVLAAAQLMIILDGTVVTLPHTILEGHRFIVRPVRAGEAITSWNTPFARASRDLEIGDYVCTPTSLAAVTGTFPYLGLPGGGYQTVPGTTAAS